MPGQARLIEIDYPEFGQAERAPLYGLEDYRHRMQQTLTRMEREGLSHLLVYGDREHFANLRWLAGFDPRFEEALLILGREREPMLLVGIECDRYAGASPLTQAGLLRHRVYDGFSLPDIGATGSPEIRALLSAEGIGPDSRVGIAGWKQYAASPLRIDAPAYLVDAARSLADAQNVVNAAGLFTNPRDGLRTSLTANDIAWFEYSNTLASNGMRRVLHAIRDGVVDHDLVAHAGFGGFPLGCHWGLKTAANRVSLSSPNGSRVQRGGPWSGNICYWGSNCCRAGWAADSEADLPDAARDYIDAFAGPYLLAMAEWFRMLTIGRRGGEIYDMIHRTLPFAVFGIALSPGHLIHFDEWIGSPIFRASDVALRSGMLFQSDVIPSSASYYSTRMEDGFVLADAALRADLASMYPDCAARIDRRRAFMLDTLGIGLPEEVLPLSNLCGIVPPFVFQPRRVLAIR